MDVRLARVELRQDHLEHLVRELDQRVRVLEAGLAQASAVTAPPAGSARVAVSGLAAVPGVAAPVAAAVAFAPVSESRAELDESSLVSGMALAGRALLVFGGAYVLRALTDAGTLPLAIGAGLGLVYASVWLAAAYLGAIRQPLKATLDGGVALVIGVPLIWESTARFGLLAPETGTAALGGFALVALLVAWHRHLHLLAWLATAGVIVGGVALLFSTGVPVPIARLMIGLGIVTLWLGYDREWVEMRWVVAAVANLLVVGVTARALGGHEPAAVAISVQVFLLASYLGLTAARTLVRGRNVIPFEVVQTVLGLIVGLGGAIAVVQASGSGMLPLGVASLGLGVITYAVAFAFVDRRQGRGLNFYFYTTFALALTLVGGTLLLADATASLLWGGLAILLTVTARRVRRVALTLHGATYAIVAGWMSGLFAGSVSALTASAAYPWPGFTLTAWAVLLAAVFCCLVRPPRDADGGPWTSRVPRATLDTVFGLSAAGVLVAYLVPLLAGTPGANADAGVVATLRTVVLSAAAIAMAVAGRTERLLEMRWLVYPLLVLIGVKLLVEDFPRSAPSTLFLALAVYGGALIIAPRLLGGGTSPTAAEEAHGGATG
jgi:hypothetical protein